MERPGRETGGGAGGERGGVLGYASAASEGTARVVRLRERRRRSEALGVWRWPIGAVAAVGGLGVWVGIVQERGEVWGRVSGWVFLGGALAYMLLAMFRAAGGWRGWVWFVPLLVLEVGMFVLGVVVAGAWGVACSRDGESGLVFLMNLVVVPLIGVLGWVWLVVRAVVWRGLEG